MAIELTQTDFERLVNIVSQHGDWQHVRGRIDFMLDVFAGSPRKAKVLENLDLDGTPRSTAIRVIGRLSQFGQDEPGRETLGVLINKLLVYLGGGSEADFLRNLLSRYRFATLPAATQPVDNWYGNENSQTVTEKIIGENTLRDIFVLERLLHISYAVVRINNPIGLGTGFLVAKDMVITNNHVIPDQETAKQSDFWFNYQLDRFGKECVIQIANILPNGLFYTSPIASHNARYDELDYTVVQIQNIPENLVPLTLRPTSPVRDSRVTIIQHPRGRYKKISMQNNFIEYVDQYVIQYTTSTEPGSSGSPVLNDDFEVIAIHHAGGNLTEPTTKRCYLRNEAIRSSAVLDDIQMKAPSIFDKLVNNNA